MTAVAQNICPQNLQSQKDFAYLPLPRSAKFNELAENIFTTAYKAGFLRQVYSLGLQILADFKGGSPFLYTYETNFFLKMPRSEKVSDGAPGVPDASHELATLAQVISLLSDEELADQLSSLPKDELMKFVRAFRAIFLVVSNLYGNISQYTQEN